VRVCIVCKGIWRAFFGYVGRGVLSTDGDVAKIFEARIER
jgi:hypothetical protein